MNDENFVMHREDIRMKTDNGEYLSGQELTEYLKKEREKLLTITDKANVGDVVKLKRTNDVVTITVNNGELFAYEGFTDKKPNSLILFNQEDIEEVLSRSKSL